MNVERKNLSDSDSYRRDTQAAFDLHRAQPSEWTARELIATINHWPADELLRHAGIWTAILLESRKYSIGHSFWALLVVIVLRLFRSRYAGTWNDHYIARWQLSHDPAAVPELHRRCHLTGDKWRPVVESCQWAVSSVRSQDPEFDLEWRTYVAVHCPACLNL